MFFLIVAWATFFFFQGVIEPAIHSLMILLNLIQLGNTETVMMRHFMSTLQILLESRDKRKVKPVMVSKFPNLC